MLHGILVGAGEWALFTRIDASIAEAFREAGRCGGRLHVADYARKPRGLGFSRGEGFTRFSFCCGSEGCRRRSTPPSVRYFGSRVYASGCFLVVSALSGGCGAAARKLCMRLGIARRTLRRWQRRYMDEGVDGLLHDATWPAGTPPVPPWKVREVAELTKSPPDGEATHWTLRAMAARVGLAFSTVRKIWQEHGLVPHRFREFKFSNDPAFVDKLRDIAGLYVNLPEHTVVLSVEEKSQIQALGRTQAPLPMKKGHPERRCPILCVNGLFQVAEEKEIQDEERASGAEQGVDLGLGSRRADVGR